MIKGAIFDMDGTLLESMHMWNNLSELYLKHLGVDVKEKLPKYIEGLSYRDTVITNVKKYLPDMNDDDIIEGSFGYMRHFYKYEVKPKKGAAEFLKRLKDEGVKICMATATDRNILEPALIRLDMLKYFSEIFTCQSVGKGKTDPLIFRTALEFLGTEKSETYIFEDALYAIETAKADGFPVAAVYDVNEEEQEKIKSIADIYFTDYEDFFKYLKDK